MLLRTKILTLACLVASLALMAFAAPRPKAATLGVVTVACPETGSCWLKATYRLHPSYTASTDSVKLVWAQGTGNVLATRYTDGSADSIQVARGTSVKNGTVTATVHRTGVSQASAPATAPWTVPAIVAPPEPVDSLDVKVQVGALWTTKGLALGPNVSVDFCGYALYNDGTRALVKEMSGPGCL
jgi:hypothetical protein